jgi:hypothetical protein
VSALYGYHPLTLRLLAGMIRDDPMHPGEIAIATEYNPIPDLTSRKHHILERAYTTLLPQARELLSCLAAFRFAVEFQTIQVITPFQSEYELKETLKGLVGRGLLLFDRQKKRYDLHPIVREYAYDRLLDKQLVHDRLRNYFELVPRPQRVRSLEDLTPVIELYHHTLSSGQYNEAFRIYNGRIRPFLYYHLGEYELDIQLLDAIPRMPNKIQKLGLKRRLTSHEWTSRLRESGTRISWDGRGRTLDTIFVERLWRSVKYEEVYLKDYQTVSEARNELAAYFQFYNYERYHQSLDYKTPFEVYRSDHSLSIL